MIAVLVRGGSVALRAVLPAATLVLAALVDLLPIPNAAPQAVAPSLLLCCYYYWAVHRPRLLPSPVVFVLGAAYDLAAGLPLGMTPLLLLLVRRAMRLREDRWLARSFELLWFGFALAAAILAFVRWLVASLWWGRLFDLAPLLAEATLSVALFPIVAWLLAGVELALAERRRASGG